MLFAVSVTTGRTVVRFAFPLIVTEPVVVPVGVEPVLCENCTTMVHVAPAVNVVPHVPPAPPVGRE